MAAALSAAGTRISKNSSIFGEAGTHPGVSRIASHSTEGYPPASAGKGTGKIYVFSGVVFERGLIAFPPLRPTRLLPWRTIMTTSSEFKGQFYPVYQRMNQPTALIQGTDSTGE